MPFPNTIVVKRKSPVPEAGEMVLELREVVAFEENPS